MIVLIGIALAEPISGEMKLDELLGPEAPAPTTSTTTQPSVPDLPWWPIPLALIGGGLFWASRKGKLPTLPKGPVTVAGRVPLANNAGLAVVDVDTLDGGQRRLLIGFGGGVPGLVADLGSTGFESVLVTETEVAPPAPPAPQKKPEVKAPPRPPVTPEVDRDALLEQVLAKAPSKTWRGTA